MHQAENEALSKMQIEAVNSSVINDDDSHDTFEATTTTRNAATLPKKSFCLLSWTISKSHKKLSVLS